MRVANRHVAQETLFIYIELSYSDAYCRTNTKSLRVAKRDRNDFAYARTVLNGQRTLILGQIWGFVPQMDLKSNFFGMFLFFLVL